MGNRLQDLFDVKTLSGQDLVSSPPKTLGDMASSGSATTGSLEAAADLARRVRFRVDYTDFSNFVFFNSALDYFNVSGERVLNEYPYDGTHEDQLRFLSQSDGYQSYLIDVWPRFSGSARLAPAVASSGSVVYVSAPDNALSSGTAAGGFLALGSSSWTYEMHLDVEALPSGASDRAVVFQRIPSGSSTGSVTVSYDLTGTFYFSVCDSSGTTGSAAVALSTGSRYMAWVLDRTASSSLSWSLYTTDPVSGSGLYQSQRPVVIASGSFAVGPFSTAAGRITVGSGSLDAGLTTVCPSFRINEFRMWSAARTSDQLFANYNTRVFRDTDAGLRLYWRFMDEVSASPANTYLPVLDRSGHRIDGAVTGSSLAGDPFYVSMPAGPFGADGNGMSPQDLGELRLNWRDTQVQALVASAQASGSLYDRNNSNLITNLVPQQFLLLEEGRNTRVLKDLLYLMGRQFDELKVAIDSIPQSVLPSFTDHGGTPDALLEDALRFWGWDPKGSFLSKEAFQFFFGFDVISVEQADYDNQRLDTVLADIKGAFWRRTLQNLSYIYKRKGTRESVEALLRVYGLDEKVVKLKEFGLQPNVSIQTRRINSDKSATALRMTGTLTVESEQQQIPHPGNLWTHYLHIRFPAPTDEDLPVTLLTGSVKHVLQVSGGLDALAHSLAMPLGPLVSGSATFFTEELRYHRRAPGTRDLISGELIDTTGSFSIVTSDGSGAFSTGTFGEVPVFDGRWYTLVQHREPSGSSGSLHELHFLRLDEDTVVDVYRSFSTGTVSSTILPGGYDFSLGRHVVSDANWNTTSGSEFWVRNAQVWAIRHSEIELLDHALNPFSHGGDTPEREMSMSLQWEFDQSKDAQLADAVYDSAYKHFGGPLLTGSFFINNIPVSSSAVEYLRDVFDYNFIAPPEYSWNEEKVRALDTVRVPPGDQWNDSSSLALEFNLIDALNEDISLMMSSLDNWNNVIGDAANRYRESYPVLDRLRTQYFQRLSGRINFRAFADFLDFFDRSFVDLVRRLLPARANFKGAEFVVESHMLERPKAQITFRRQQPILVPEGRIVISTPYPNLLPTGTFVNPGDIPFLFDDIPTLGYPGSLTGFGDVGDPSSGGQLV